MAIGADDWGTVKGNGRDGERRDEGGRDEDGIARLGERREEEMEEPSGRE